MANQVYKKGGNLGGARHGDSYQVHVLMLMFERAAKAGNTFADFRLATEMEAAGKFDDAVLNWSCGTEPKWLFVQVKHKQKATKLTESIIFPVEDKDKDKGDFSVYKYLTSMRDIMYSSCEFDGDKKFIIYTNCAIDNSIAGWFTKADMEEEGALLPNNKEQFWSMNGDESRVKNIAQFMNQDFVQLVKIIKAMFIDGCTDIEVDILSKYRGALVQKVLLVEKKVAKFTPRFIKKAKLTNTEILLRQQLFAEDSTLDQLQAFSTCNEKVVEILTSKSKSQNNLPCFVSDAEVFDYLKRFIFAVNQPDNEELKHTIQDDLQHFSPTRGVTASDCYIQLLYIKLQKMIYDRLDSATENVKFLSNEDLRKELATLQQTIEQSSSDLSTMKFNGEMQNLRVKLTESMQLPDQYPLAVKTTTKEGLLTSLKVYHLLENRNYRFATFKDIKNSSFRKEMLETLCKASAEILLLIKDDGTKIEYNVELLETVLKNTKVKLILLTFNEDRCKQFFENYEFSTSSDRNTRLDKLDKQSQQMLLEKHVIFQGVELSLADVIQTRKHIFRDNMLEKVIQDEMIEIGGGFPEAASKSYIPRVIRRCDSNDSTDSNLSDSDEDASKILSYYREIEFVLEIPSLFKSKSVVVLSAEPGMGKTTLWTHLTPLVKQTYLASWVLNVKLLECVNELRNVHRFNDIEMVTNVLIRVCQIKSTFEQSLFTSFLRDGEPQDTIIFLDGFDELPYDTISSVMSFLKILQYHSYLFVNTRIHQRVVLEDALETVTFTLDPINRDQQMVLLKSSCDVPPNDQELCKQIEQLFNKIRSKSLEFADKIIGVPLMVVMLAEIYRPYVQAFLKHRDYLVLNTASLDSLTLLDIFDRFAYSSFCRQSIEKQKLDAENPHTERLLHKENYVYKGFVKLHSYLGLVKLVKQKKMHLIFREKWKLCDFEEQARFLDSAIVSKYENEIPYFTHASFCEFFAAKCLFNCVCRMPQDRVRDFFVKKDGERNAPKKQNIADLYDLYHKVLRDYATVRKFFFLMAKEDGECLTHLEELFWSMRPYPLRWACEEGFGELVQRLLEEDPSIINSRTKQNETVLHLSAAQGNDAICALLLNAKVEKDLVSKTGLTALHVASSAGHFAVASVLVARGASLLIKDRNQQTPLHLAAQAGHANIVRLFVRKGIDVNLLNKREWSALHLAVFSGHAEVVKSLLVKKTRLRIGKATNWPMILGNLMTHGHSDIVNMLVEYEARTFTDPTNVKEILLWAIRRDHTMIADAMKVAGSKLHFYDAQSNLCTYRLALRKNCFQISDIIISNSASPLHAAAEAGCTCCVRILLEDNQVDVNAVDSNGSTPLDLAMKKGHTDVVRILLGTANALNGVLLLKGIKKRTLSELRCSLNVKDVMKEIQEDGELNLSKEEIEKLTERISEKKIPKVKLNKINKNKIKKVNSKTSIRRFANRTI